MQSKIFRREGYLREDYRYFHLRDTAGQERDFHFHDFDKLVILLSGRVDYTVEGVTYSLLPWDVLLVKHHTIHRAVIDQKVPYDRVVLYLDAQFADRYFPGAALMECFQLADRQGCHRLSPGPEEKRLLSDLVERLDNAQEDEDFGADAVRDTLMIQLLVFINRMIRRGESLPAREMSAYDPKIARALSYINENLGRDMSVEEIAEYAYLSKYYFMRLFKAQTGTTVHAYLRQKRLLNAARLIREGAAVSKAAEDSGFRDYSAFYRAFRETFGISPGQLK